MMQKLSQIRRSTQLELKHKQYFNLTKNPLNCSRLGIHALVSIISPLASFCLKKTQTQSKSYPLFSHKKSTELFQSLSDTFDQAYLFRQVSLTEMI